MTDYYIVYLSIFFIEFFSMFLFGPKQWFILDKRNFVHDHLMGKVRPRSDSDFMLFLLIKNK